MSHPTPLDSGYLISEDEQYTLVKLSRVLGLLEDLLIMQDRRDGPATVDSVGLQSLFSLLQGTIEPILASTSQEKERYISSLEQAPLALLIAAIRGAGGLLDAVDVEQTIADLERTPIRKHLADALRDAAATATATGRQSDAWSD